MDMNDTKKEKEVTIMKENFNERKINLLLIFYCVIQIILLILIRLTEFTVSSQIYGKIMYTAIVIDFLAMFYLYYKYGRNRLSFYDNLIPLAFTFMLCADTFLCLIDDIYIMGYFFFCLVELCYAIYLKPSKKNIISRICLYLILLVLVKIEGLFNLENMIALLNLTLLIGNVVSAWIKERKYPMNENLLFAIGITLFFLCDGSIAVRMLTENGTLIYMVFATIVWTAYIPAQIFILFTYVNKCKRVNI